MNLVLDYWNRPRQSVKYDTVSGAGRVRWVAGKSSQLRGWACRCGRKWYAVWCDSDGLIFQHEERRWRIGPDVKSRLEADESMRRFQLIGSSEELLFERTYFVHPPADITWDSTDDEMSDFFLWLHNVVAKPSRQADIKRTILGQ